MASISNFKAHPVQYGRPPLHGDALEDCEHGEPDVVEGGDAEVGPLPLLQADGHVEVAGVGAQGGRGLGAVVAGVAGLRFHHNTVCNKNDVFNGQEK